MFKRLLIPLDGSKLAEMALPVALSLAEKFESDILLLRVVDAPHERTEGISHAHDTMLDTVHDQLCSECRAYLAAAAADIQQKIGNNQMQVHTRMVEADSVVQAILDVVARDRRDAIVMSTHGRGGLDRLLFGSVAERVLRRATVPVVLIKGEELVSS